MFFNYVLYKVALKSTFFMKKPEKLMSNYKITYIFAAC
ncbi:hypothetical protein EVA_08765 [gut metagenome]|uniref:Uncharacterized protein n=1 Tax=gut metagenome TaxID=749906 RepID=J9GLR9_9ZZZZ